MFQPRTSTCSFNKSIWEKERDNFHCPSSINVYHCIQDERNRSGEICIQPVWVQPKYCPEYNTGAHTLDTIPCNVSPASCPDVLYLSNEVYKYPVCLNKTSNDNVSTKIIRPLPWDVIGVCVSLGIIILVCFIFLACYFRRRKFFSESNTKKDEERKALLLLNDIDVPFFKTKAFYEGLAFLTNGGKLLCLCGQWGSGKTSVAKNVYIEVTNTRPVIIRDPLQLDICNPPVILDDVLNKDISEDDGRMIMEKINNMLETCLCSKTFIIVIVDGKFNTLPESLKSFLLSGNDKKCVDLPKSYTKGDENQILFKNFDFFCPDDNFSKFFEDLKSKHKQNLIGFPEICALLCRCRKNPYMTSPRLFRNSPLQHLMSLLKKMHQSDNNKKFMMLVYMSLNQMEINVAVQNDGFDELLESCNCNDETSKSNNQLEVPSTEAFGDDANKKTSSGKENLNAQTPKVFTTKTERKELPETSKVGQTNVHKPKESSLSTSSKHKKGPDFLTSIMPMEFVDKVRETSIYRLQHDVIKRMVLIVFGTHHFDKLLKFSKPEDLKGWIKEKKTLSGLLDKVKDTKPYLNIDGEQWVQYKDCIENMQKHLATDKNCIKYDNVV